MRIEWLRQSGGTSLIVFFNGWGMDAAPLRPLTVGEHDIVVCSEYGHHFADMAPIHDIAAAYQRRLLICWSMGVYFGQIFFQDTSLVFDKSIAVNGTLSPIDDAHGIPPRTFQATLANLDAGNLEKFYRRMCRPGGDFQLFEQNRPRRSISSQRSELAFIGGAVTQAARELGDSIYSDVVIARGDLVVPAANQLRFWQRRATRKIQGPHFPFYRWQSWEELVAGLSS